MLSWTISRRSVVQRWPAVPTAEKRIARVGKLEVGARRDDHRVVAAELEQRAAEALRHARADRASHRRRAGGGDQRDARIVDQRLADVALALDQLDQTVRRIAEPAERASHDAP